MKPYVLQNSIQGFAGWSAVGHTGERLYFANNPHFLQ